MGVSIKVTGIPTVAVMLKGKEMQAEAQIQKAIKEATFFVQGEVVQSIAGRRAEPMSVDTGRFKNSVAPTFPKKFEGKVESNVEYARVLEFGSSKRAARHHFRNSAKRNTNKVKGFIAKKLAII